MYNTSNFESENIKKFKFEGGVSQISMINQFCVFLLVGNNKNFPDNKLIIWNNDKKEIYASLNFSSKNAYWPIPTSTSFPPQTHIVGIVVLLT